jgi:hypothetical protein
MGWIVGIVIERICFGFVDVNVDIDVIPPVFGVFWFIVYTYSTLILDVFKLLCDNFFVGIDGMDMDQVS